MINLDNKVALLPGGATMIGRKVAHEFIRAGARVTVCDIDETGGRELQQEVGEAVDPEEVARTVVFLCSDAASGINGADVPVDSGYSAIGAEGMTDQVGRLSG